MAGQGYRPNSNIANQTEKLPIDRGWAWVVLSASTAIAVLHAGLLRCFGLFFVAFLTEFRSEVSETAIINAVQSAVYAVVSIPVLSIGVERFSERQVAFTGFLLCTSGFAVSSLARNLYFLIFSISILVGTGSALGFQPVFVIVGKYFNKYRGLANGVLMSGTCVGGLALPPLIQYFLVEYGLKGALLMTAGVYSHILICVLLLRPRSFYVRYSPPDRGKQSERGKQSSVDREMEVKTSLLSQNDVIVLNGSTVSLSNSKQKESYEKSTRNTDVNNDLKGSLLGLDSQQPHAIDKNVEVAADKSAHMFFKFKLLLKMMSKNCIKSLTNYEVILFVVYYSLASIPGGLGQLFLPAFAKDRNISDFQIVVMLILMGGSDFIGRITCGYLGDRPSIKRTHLLFIAQLIVCVVVNCARFVQEVWSFYLFSGLYGIVNGVQFALCVPLVTDIVGTQDFPTTLGLANFFHQISISCTAPLLGYLRDVSGSYVATFHYIGGCSLVACVLLLSEPCIKRCQEKRSAVRSNQTKT